jgi:hypothetical protein
MSALFRHLAIGGLSVLLGVGAVITAGCVAPTTNPEESRPDVEIVTMYVGPETVECVGVAPQECLQVRYALDEEYQLFYSNIQGFDYEPGYTYELIVEKVPVDNPPADASSIQWTLIDVVSKTPVVDE